MEKIIFLGYGNPDRGDDGVAWYIFHQLFAEYGMPDIDLLDLDVHKLTDKIDIWFHLQLLPEISELISDYSKAVFIDAHTGEIKEDLNFKKITPLFQNSPFTHHITPAALLSLSESMHNKFPESWLISVRGFSFKFEQSLSSQTKILCDKAIELLKHNFFE
jgi:hydrogenase maturation protease